MDLSNKKHLFSIGRSFVKQYKSSAPFDLCFHLLTAVSALSIIFIDVLLVIVLFKESFLAISKFGFLDFLFSTKWNPVKDQYGAAVPILGTIITTSIALFISTPVSLGIAIFITEIAPDKLKGVIGSAIELLAAIPSIIYGMWGFFVLSPLMANYVEPFLQKSLSPLPLIGILFRGNPVGLDLLTSGTILSIMIIPFSAMIARDAIKLTPDIIKESAYSLGSTTWETIKNVILPYSKYGILGGITISLGRALGETMAVAFVLGNRNQIPSSLFDPTTTITVKLANEFAEADKDIYFSSLFYLVLLLFFMSFVILAISKYLIAKTRRLNVKL